MEDKKKRRITPEHSAALNKGHIGKQRSQSAKDKISATLKNRKWTNEQRIKRGLLPIETNEEKKERRKRTEHSSLEARFEKLLILLGFDYVRQYKVGQFKCDFYLPQLNLIYEINGCYVHCCETCGYEDAPYNGISALEKRKNDKDRIHFIESNGYIVHVIWEHSLEDNSI